MRKFFFAAALAVVALVGVSASADAAFSVRVSGSTLNPSPQGASNPGQSLFNYSITDNTTVPGTFTGGLTLTSRPFFPGGNPGEVSIDLGGTIGYTGTGPATIVIELTRTGFNLGDGPGSLSTLLGIHDIVNATVTVQSFVSYGTGGNLDYAGVPTVGDYSAFGTGSFVGAVNPNGGLVSSNGQQTYSDADAPVTGATTHSNAAVGLNQPFSITQRVEITFSGTGSAVSLDYLTTVSSPAPAGLVLGLAGLPVFGLGAYIRRRRAVKA